METLCSSGFKTIVGALDQLGIPTGELLAKSGVARRDIEDPEGRIAVKSEAIFWDELSRLTADSQIGLTSVQYGGLGIYPLLDYLSASSENLWQSLTMIARYIQLVNEAWQPKVVRSGGTSFVFADVSCNEPSYRHSVEFGMGVIARRVKLLSGQNLSPSAVTFQHNAIESSIDRYVQEFGCDVEFGSERNSLVYYFDFEQVACIKADPNLKAALGITAERALEKLNSKRGDLPGSLISHAKLDIAAQLKDGEPSLKHTAKKLALSERTLQRRLMENEKTYKELVTEVRKNAASELLGDPSLPIIEVGFLLGYANTSAFYRAFRSWFGETPAAFRSRLS